MAFATSQVVQRRADDAWRTTGKWTGSMGDPAGTITVPGAIVDMIVFNSNIASGGPVSDPVVSWTSSNGVATVTVNNSNTVTNGRFTIISR